eukprot:jgi/Botrbrau1/7568/Bobra.0159s0018.1
MADVVRGQLLVTVHESSGKNKDDDDVWDPTFTEGFVKVEIRGAARNVKAISTIQKVVPHEKPTGNVIFWNEELSLDVLDGANELRLMLCREKKNGQRVGTSVVAACGIFVADIIEAVPIDKYFELFKPGAGGDGGFIRIGMEYKESTPVKPAPAANGLEHEHLAAFKPMLSFKHELPDKPGADFAPAPDTPQQGDKKLSTANGSVLTPADKSPSKKKKGRPLLFAIATALVAAVVIKVVKT